MSGFLSFIFGLWIIGTFVAWPIMWFKRTDRSSSPLARRLVALGHALGWPYFIVKIFTDRQQRQREAVETERRRQSILGNTPPSTSEHPTASGTSQIRDPFENR